MPVPPTPLRTIKENPNAQHPDNCPDYEVAVSRTNSNATNSTSLHWTSPVEEGPQKVHHRKVSRDLPRVEQYKYSYRLVAASTPLQFFIFVEPAAGKPAGNFTFRVALRANGLERYLCEPTVRKLKIDPRHLQFVVFVFPGKTTLPAGCLWSLRVWLRINGVDHRLFGDDELWVGKDPDFNSIGDASFARLKGVDVKEQVYHAYVGKALVTFTIRWNKCSEGTYKYALDYEAGGVGGTLFENFLMKVDGDPRTTTFLIYSVPSKSLPAGASHRLRVWVRSHVPLSSTDASTSYVLPFNDSYVYQRIWKCDTFKVGGRLDFDTLGSKMIMAFATGDPETILVTEHVKEDKPRATYGNEKQRS